MNVTVYVKDGCPNCVTAKQLLKAKQIAHTTLAVDYNPALLDDLPDGARQMPQIFIDGQYVGGLAGLQAALKQIGL